jgi:hypothetical protein
MKCSCVITLDIRDEIGWQTGAQILNFDRRILALRFVQLRELGDAAEVSVTQRKQ